MDGLWCMAIWRLNVSRLMLVFQYMLLQNWPIDPIALIPTHPSSLVRFDFAFEVVLVIIIIIIIVSVCWRVLWLL